MFEPDVVDNAEKCQLRTLADGCSVAWSVGFWLCGTRANKIEQRYAGGGTKIPLTCGFLDRMDIQLIER